MLGVRMEGRAPGILVKSVFYIEDLLLVIVK